MDINRELALLEKMIADAAIRIADKLAMGRPVYREELDTYRTYKARYSDMLKVKVLRRGE